MPWTKSCTNSTLSQTTSPTFRQARRTRLSSLSDGACLQLLGWAPRVCARDISRVSPVTQSFALLNQSPLSHGSVLDTISCGKWSEHSTSSSQFGSNHFGLRPSGLVSCVPFCAERFWCGQNATLCVLRHTHIFLVCVAQGSRLKA